MYIDHIVISTKNLKKSIKFYASFLGKPVITKLDASWKVGEVKLFLTTPYVNNPLPFNKHNLGLNHVAFGVKNLSELRKFEKILNKAKIVHSGVMIDTFGKREFIWFDDPDGIRLEFYFRP